MIRKIGGADGIPLLWRGEKLLPTEMEPLGTQVKKLLELDGFAFPKGPEGYPS